ncbi:MAG: hypothetical protein ACXWFZ_10925 [Nitrososphaeraceae archaeon]
MPSFLQLESAYFPWLKLDSQKMLALSFGDCSALLVRAKLV